VLPYISCAITEYPEIFDVKEEKKRAYPPEYLFQREDIVLLKT